MIAQQSQCRQGVTLTTLSAWRDRELATAEAQTLAAHISTCRFCQATLAEFTTVATTLQDQRLPTPDGRLWRGVHDAITRRGRTLHPLTMRRAVVTTMGTLAVVLLVVAVALLRVYLPEKPPISVAPTASPTQVFGTPTATVPPVVQPGKTVPASWSLGTLPANFTIYYPQTSPFELYGATAYACTGTDKQANQIVISHDRGQHWDATTTLPAGVTQCNTLVGATNNPAVLILNSGVQGMSYISVNSGATWQQTGTADIQAVATFNGAIYAILTNPDPPAAALNSATTADSGKRQPLAANHSCPCSYPTLVVSHDHLKTWQSIDTGIAPQSNGIRVIGQFWLNPVTGSLLALTQFDNTLWLSDDGGQHWRKLNFPTGFFLDFFTFTVQAPTRAQPWHLCISGFCSTDSAASWHPIPSGATPFAIGTDGTLYAAQSKNERGTQLYILPPGAKQWQIPAPAPFSLPGNVYMFLFYSAATTGDILWMVFSSGYNEPPVTPPYVTIAFS